MENPSSFLETIALETKKRVETRKQRLPLEKIKDALSQPDAPKPLDFAGILFNPSNLPPIIIAELKKSSPSAGILRPIYNVKEIVSSYIQGGANALSILTEEKYFMGDIYHLIEARQAAENIPILRKDFIIDEYQIYESRYYGADAILLIRSFLDDEKFQTLANTALNIGLSVLAETHTEKELTAVLDLHIDHPSFILGVNARNLDTFNINLEETIRLISSVIPSKIPDIAESGIKNSDDILKFLHITKRTTNIAFLIGTSLITQTNPGIKLKQLISEVRTQLT